MSVAVRRAEAADSAALAALRWTWRVDEAGEQPSGTALEYAETLRAWWAAHPDHLAVLAADWSGQDVGMAWLALGDRVPGPSGPRARSAWLQSVYVAPERRNAGIGAGLLAHVADLARIHGCAYVAVHPSPSSMSLYERAGYAVSDGLLELRLNR